MNFSQILQLHGQGHQGNLGDQSTKQQNGIFDFRSLPLPPPAAAAAAASSSIGHSNMPTSYPIFDTSGLGSIDPNATAAGGPSSSALAAAGETSEDAKAKKTRKRQQTSCSDCHRRKQKCNKEVPCDRCIKRGTADTCKIMLIGEGDESPSEHGQGADASGALAGSTGGGPSSSSTRPSPAEPKKRKRKDETDELAARVQQLETIIRMQTQLQAGHLRGDETPEDNTDAKSEQSAVEEAAVAALGQLSKAMPKEGGTEARIYSGPGSVTDFLVASGIGRDTDIQVDRIPRARVADMKLYSAHTSIWDTANCPMRLTALADALEEQKAKLPPALICHYLFDLYYRTGVFAPNQRMMPRAAIQLCYDGLWSKPEDKDMSKGAIEARNRNLPQLASPASLAFVSHVFVMLALALYMSPDQTPETHQLAATMFAASRSAFMASEQREQPTYSVISALLSQAGWLKFAGSPSLGFTFIAQAIRFAQSMGLHREPTPKWGLGPFESEIRRRIWWVLVVADRGHSLGYGRPYSIFDRHCDVQLPANIDDVDLTADGPINVKPMDVVTDFTFMFCSIAISKVQAEIIDRAFSCKTPTYATILELDALVTRTEHEAVPLGFKNPSITDMVERPWIKDQYTQLQVQIAWLRAMLHRPYLLRPVTQPDHFAGSRAATIMLSQRMLTLMKEIISRMPFHHLSYFGYAFNVFEPSVNLAMAILQDPSQQLDSWVKEGMQMLEQMSRVNKVAGEGLESLKFMREKYLSLSASPATLSFGSGSPQTNSVSPLTGPPSTSSGLAPAAVSDAPTPNTLFNQFFKDYASPVGDSLDFEKLLNVDTSAPWMAQPAEIDEWPMGMPRLEGETDASDYWKMLGL